MTTAVLQGAAGCVRCSRSEHDHHLRDHDQADEIQRRIWKALGWPCAEYVDTAAAAFAGQQAATSRWARNRHPAPPPRPVTTIPGPDTLHGPALARAALARALNHPGRER